MADAKGFLEMGLGDLKTGADFKDDGVPAVHAHDASVGAGSPVKPPESRTINVTATPEQLFEMGKTPEGRAAVAEMFGIVNREVVDDVTDLYDGDPEGKAAWNDLVDQIGGQENVPLAAKMLREAHDLFGLEEVVSGEGLTLEEQNASVLGILANYEEVLNNPDKAQKVLDAMNAHPERDPLKSFLNGTCSEDLKDAIRRLYQASQREPPTGRSKRKIDGQTY